MDWLKRVHQDKKVKRPELRTGDDVRVSFKIREGGKERLAHFEGVVLRVRGSGPSRTFTVRRLTHGEGVERVFPVDAKMIEKIEVLRHAKTHRSRIYFLRHVAKRTRLATVEKPAPKKDSAAESKPKAKQRASKAAKQEASLATADESVGSEVSQS